MKKCPNGHEVSDNVKFCPTCGANVVSEKIYCTKCGSERKGTEKYCPNCGEVQPNYVKKSSSKLWIWVVVGLFLLFGLLIGSGGVLYLYLNNKGFFSHKMTEAQTAPDTTVVADNTVDAELKSPPSIQKLGVLFSDMTEGKKSALKDYGFILVDKKTKKEVSEYDEEMEYEVVKEVYILHYNTTSGDKTMTATYVYADSYGEPSMIIECDTDTWENLKMEAKNSLKKFGDNSFFLNNFSFISFNRKGIIEITTECSISW